MRKILLTTILICAFNIVLNAQICPTGPNFVCNCGTFDAPPVEDCINVGPVTDIPLNTRPATIVDPCTGITHTVTISGPMLNKPVFANFNYGDYVCPMMDNPDGTRTYITTSNSRPITFDFSPPIKNPNLFITSLGNLDVPDAIISYAFTDGSGAPVPVTILSQNPTFPLTLSSAYDPVTNLENSVSGEEGGGVIGMQGTFSTIVATPDDNDPSNGIAAYECYSLFTISICRETTPVLDASDVALTGCFPDAIADGGYLPINEASATITETQLFADGATYSGNDGPLVNISYTDVVTGTCNVNVVRTYSIENCGGCTTNTCTREFTITQALDGTASLSCPAEVDLCNISDINLAQDFVSNIGLGGSPYTGTFSGLLAPYVTGAADPGGNAILQLPSTLSPGSYTLDYEVADVCGCLTEEVSCTINLIRNCAADGGGF